MHLRRTTSAFVLLTLIVTPGAGKPHGTEFRRLATFPAYLNSSIGDAAAAEISTVTADGKGKIRSVKIDPTVVDPKDVEMLEDLVLAAVSEAQTRAQALYEEEMRKLSGGFSLPFQLPEF